MNKDYRGRFAPSPTGPLHFGSLIAAAGSYLEARSRDGEWLLRIEDLDPPREIPGAADDIIRALDRFGFEWDGEILYQSERYELYAQALETLTCKGLTYPCGCTRKEILRTAEFGEHGAIYPGACRNGLPEDKQARSVRIRTPDEVFQFSDRVQGTQAQNLLNELGDFLLKRADGLWAYNLAVVVDDGACAINDVVRGCDLLSFTNIQIFLQQGLDLPTPGYCHLPLASHADGCKLSKQTLAQAITDYPPERTLHQALTFLNHPPPEDMLGASLFELWQWAIANWQLERIPATRTMPAPEGF